MLDPAERRAVLAQVFAGSVRLLDCAPERLATLVSEFRDRRIRVSFLAVDEAHCIVEWGDEFGPVYRRLGEYRYLLRDPVTLAVTGSATRETRAEILQVLRIPHAAFVLESFDRPNLMLTVNRVSDDRERFAHIRALVRHALGGSIVYTPARRLTELVARALLRWGIRAVPYHAGLSPETRRQTLLDFLDDRVPVVVATTAFGMGIDKPDVRRVIHWGPARTLEAYYQEAGRAGRDGSRADCVLLWRPADFAWNGCDAQMRRYLERRGCRRRALLEYLGERGRRCGGCDACGIPAN